MINWLVKGDDHLKSLYQGGDYKNEFGKLKHKTIYTGVFIVYFY